MVASAIQRVLLALQLLVLHVACVGLWWSLLNKQRIVRASAYTSLMVRNPALLIFYLMYMAFLSLTSLQLKYDIHCVRGGNRLTHSTELHTWLAFKAYMLIPFLEELRVLTDWTITSTALNFWMWMKIEDAQQGLFQTRCDMDARRMVRPQDPRPLREKLLQGAALLLGLYLLVVGPILFFSPLNLLVQPNLVLSGTLVAKLRIETQHSGTKTVQLYSAEQSNIDELQADDGQNFVDQFPVLLGQRFTLQRATFPASSDSFWQLTTALRQQLAELMSLNSSRAFVVISYEFERNSTPSTSLVPKKAAELPRSQIDDLVHVLNCTQPLCISHMTSVDVMLENLYVPSMLLDSSTTAKALQHYRMGDSGIFTTNLTLTLTFQQDMLWSVQMPCPATAGSFSSNMAGESLCHVFVNLASEMVVPIPSGSSSATSSGTNYWSVTGMYSFILFVIGSLLRSAFTGSSKRMIWEELQDTQMLESLCNGIYLSRLKGQLDREYMLYYLLVFTYRNPDLLLRVSRPKVPLDVGNPSAGGVILDQRIQSWNMTESDSSLSERVAVRASHDGNNPTTTRAFGSVGQAASAPESLATSEGLRRRIPDPNFPPTHDSNG